MMGKSTMTILDKTLINDSVSVTGEVKGIWALAMIKERRINRQQNFELFICSNGFPYVGISLSCFLF